MNALLQQPSASGAVADLLEAALSYAAKSLRVLPLKWKDKAPLTKHGVYDASSNPDIIKRWWSDHPQANIGIAIPPGYLVLDLDSQDALHLLKAEDLALPATVCARTGRGWHLWYRCSGEVRNRVGILPGVDVRAAGGYVVAPPSVHPSGEVYRWKVTLDRSKVAEAPEWLEALLRRRASEPARGGTNWGKTIAKTVPSGRRNQALAEVAGLLFRKLPAEVAAELAFCWARVKLAPRLPDREVFRTLNSIARRELLRRGGRP